MSKAPPATISGSQLPWDVPLISISEWSMINAWTSAK